MNKDDNETIEEQQIENGDIKSPSIYDKHFAAQKTENDRLWEGVHHYFAERSKRNSK